MPLPHATLDLREGVSLVVAWISMILPALFAGKGFSRLQVNIFFHTPRLPGGANDHTTTFGYGYGRSGTQWISGHGGNSDQHSDCEVSQNHRQWKKHFKDPKKAPDIPEHRWTKDEEKFPVLTDANGWQVPVR